MGQHELEPKTEHASATIEIWQPVGGCIEDLMAWSCIHWDVAKDWSVFVSEVTDTADNMLLDNDPNENAYVVMRFTTKQCKIYRRTEG